MCFSFSSVGALSSSRSDLHSYARPPPPALPSSSTSPLRAPGRERRHSRVQPRLFFKSRSSSGFVFVILVCGCCLQTSSECGSAVSTRSSLSDDEDMGWSFSWPPTAWNCFLKGRNLQIQTKDRVKGKTWKNVSFVDQLLTCLTFNSLILTL